MKFLLTLCSLFIFHFLQAQEMSTKKDVVNKNDNFTNNKISLEESKANNNTEKILLVTSNKHAIVQQPVIVEDKTYKNNDSIIMLSTSKNKKVGQ